MAQYYTVLTSLGLAKLAAAQAANEAVQLHTLHAGTGGGEGYYDEYDEAALIALTDLIDEQWSSQINTLDVDPQNPNWVVAEAAIAADAGGFMVREVGIKDIHGDLIAIGRFPATYKPILSEGAAQDLLLRIIMELGNAESVTLVIDPSVVMASRQFVDSELQRVSDDLRHDIDNSSPDVTLRPANISPSEGEPGITATPELLGADYYALYNVPQLYREFQLVLQGFSFSQPLYTGTEYPSNDIPAISHAVATPLAVETAYQWRYRDRTIEGDVSAWSAPTSFVTSSAYVERPDLTSPPDNSAGILEQPVLESSAFAVVDASDEHASTSWRIRDTAGNVVWSSLEDAENLLSIEVPAGVLDEGSIYRPQVRHHGETLGESAWSATVSFTTAGQFAGAIGEPGTQGFGVGVYPGTPPEGFTGLSGYTDPASDNYGNYQYSDGSALVFVPAFYYRIGHPASPRHETYGANAIDIAGLGLFVDRQSAEAQGYALHRAFIDGGEVKHGFFFDKYLNSKNTNNTAGRSVKNGVPISLATSSGYTSSQGMPGCSGIAADAIVLARARGEGFNCASVFQYSALALLSLAHGQAAESATHCAWYDEDDATNYPKGCNSNLSDADDSAVTFTTAGDTQAAKPLAGSANDFAKTTHNGQNCGIADVNGSMYQYALGITAPGASASSTASISNGDCYTLKESVALASLTAGFGGETDAWGTAAQLSQNYDPAPGILPWGSTTGTILFGSGESQVFAPDVSGQGWLRTACGIPAGNSALSAGGTNLFGRDACYRNNRQNLFVLCGGNWSHGSGAGVFFRNWDNRRSNSYHHSGFRAAAYGQ